MAVNGRLFGQFGGELQKFDTKHGLTSLPIKWENGNGTGRFSLKYYDEIRRGFS